MNASYSPDRRKILVTGHRGYVGSVLVPLLLKQNFNVVGIDTGLFSACTFEEVTEACPSFQKDIRLITEDDLRGVWGIVHLAALSNDPMGDLNASCTYDINHRAAVRLARQAKQAGVARFVQASTSSVYGEAIEGRVDEASPVAPLTHYAKAKLRVEQDVSQLADRTFSPVFMRAGTAYGYSAMLRTDLVVNNLLASAFTKGEVRLMSDGAAWRPLVHVQDMGEAFGAVLRADREQIHNQIFNVGTTEENFQIKQIAKRVAEEITGSRVVRSPGSAKDRRSYRVRCDKIRAHLPKLKFKWTLAKGLADLHRTLREGRFDLEAFRSDRYTRVEYLCRLLESRKVDSQLRWTT